MPRRVLMNTGGQQVADELAAQFSEVDPSIYEGLRRYWTSYQDPYEAWYNQPFIDLIGTRLKNPYDTNTGSSAFVMPPGDGKTPAPTTPSDVYKWALLGGGIDKAGQQQGYSYNPAAFMAANLNFSPLDVVRKQADIYRRIDPNFDPDKLITTDHPVFGKVVSVQNLPKLESTSAEDFSEFLGALAGVAGGALGISGFAGLHGLPGIDSLFGGLNNIFGGSGSGASGAGGAAGAVDPWLGGAGTWTPEAIDAYLSQALSGGAVGGVGGAADPLLGGSDVWNSDAIRGYLSSTEGGGTLSQAAGYSNNPMEALQQTLNRQVEQGLLTPTQAAQAIQNVSNNGSSGSGWLDSLLGNSGAGSLLSGGLQALGGLLSGNAASDAANTQADAIIQAARIAAEAAKFKPVGVTTRFGSSNFGYDANGNLTTAGYQLAPDVQTQQTQLMGASNSALQQYLDAPGAAAPMGQAAQSLFGLGQGYLGTTPQEQAARYMAEQQALLAPYRERDFSALENRLANQGRLGLATGATGTGLGAANPELEAFYNAQRMQDLKLAAEATQGGMDYTKFGAGLVGTGGDMLRSMYGTQTAAYDPFKTAIGGASMLEGLGQNAMDLGINIGAKGTAANAQSGMLLSQGMQNAANVMAPANAFSPWGNLLSGAGTMLGNYVGQQNQQGSPYRFDPYTGQQIRWN